MSSLLLKGLSYHYDGQQVIKSLNLAVEKNEIVCLLGSSGCGKTTTLKAIAGLIKPQQGSLTINDTLMSDEASFVAPQHRNIGMMFQDYALFPHLTVEKNIAFGLKGLSASEKQARVDEMLSLVHLDGYGARYPHELSGGQQQRVAMARALAYKPSLLLLDEPFSNIDAQVRFQLINDIRSILKAQQVTAIFVSHSKEEAFAFADKLAIMHEGKIAQLGSAKELFEKPNTKEVAEFLGQGIYIPASVIGTTQFETEFGSVESTKEVETDAKAGHIYLRPKQLELVNAQAGNVELVQSRFIGTEYIYQVKIADQTIEIPVSSENALDEAQPITLKILPHTVNFFTQ